MKTHHEQLQSNHENSLLGVSPEAFREGAAGGGCQIALGTREKMKTINGNKTQQHLLPQHNVSPL